MEAQDIYETAIRRAKLAGQTPSVVQFVVPQKPVAEPKHYVKPDELLAFRKWVEDIEARLERVIHSVEKFLLPPEVLKRPGLSVEPTARRPRIFDIKKAVCSKYGFSFVDLEGASRKAEVVHARQIAQHLCRRMTLHSMPSIGLQFGNRDHTTVLSSDRRISAMRQSNESFDNELLLLEVTIMASLINDRAESTAPDSNEQPLPECKGQGTGENTEISRMATRGRLGNRKTEGR